LQCLDLSQRLRVLGILTARRAGSHPSMGDPWAGGQEKLPDCQRATELRALPGGNCITAALARRGKAKR
jgi:hypothetical protein